jgi:hypothetical protein
VLMSWNIKKIGVYRKWAGLVMAILMGLHIFSGLRLFCPGAPLPSLRAFGADASALSSIASGQDSEQIAAADDGPKGPSKCGCKKQKQCPVIPRAAFTSNPTQRFNEVQRQFKSVCCYSIVSDVTDYRFVTGSGPPLSELAQRTSLYSSTSLSFTCVLLI